MKKPDPSKRKKPAPLGKRIEKAYGSEEERRREPRREKGSLPPKRINKTENPPAKPVDEKIRLNKYIADSGVCSRRDADQLIQNGEIRVNGKVVTEMGFRVSPEDEVLWKGKKLKRERLVYVLLNKPKDFITTTEDPQERNTVMHLVEKACRERIYPVGRLDRMTTGLLLLTNDGELAKKLSHPSFEIQKVYHVELDKPLVYSDMQRIGDGVMLEDGVATVDAIAYSEDVRDKRCVGIELHIGKNRIVRRIFESLGYKVMKLDRVYYAGLTKKDLPRGKWRFLTDKEVAFLKMGRFK